MKIISTLVLIFFTIIQPNLFGQFSPRADIDLTDPFNIDYSLSGQSTTVTTSISSASWRECFWHSESIFSFKTALNDLSPGNYFYQMAAKKDGVWISLTDFPSGDFTITESSSLNYGLQIENFAFGNIANLGTGEFELHFFLREGVAPDINANPSNQYSTSNDIRIKWAYLQLSVFELIPNCAGLAPTLYQNIDSDIEIDLSTATEYQAQAILKTNVITDLPGNWLKPNEIYLEDILLDGPCCGNIPTPNPNEFIRCFRLNSGVEEETVLEFTTGLPIEFSCASGLEESLLSFNLNFKSQCPESGLSLHEVTRDLFSDELEIVTTNIPLSWTPVLTAGPAINIFLQDPISLELFASTWNLNPSNLWNNGTSTINGSEAEFAINFNFQNNFPTANLSSGGDFNLVLETADGMCSTIIPLTFLDISTCVRINEFRKNELTFFEQLGLPVKIGDCFDPVVNYTYSVFLEFDGQDELNLFDTEQPFDQGAIVADIFTVNIGPNLLDACKNNNTITNYKWPQIRDEFNLKVKFYEVDAIVQTAQQTYKVISPVKLKYDVELPGPVPVPGLSNTINLNEVLPDSESFIFFKHQIKFELEPAHPDVILTPYFKTHKWNSPLALIPGSEVEYDATTNLITDGSLLFNHIFVRTKQEPFQSKEGKPSGPELVPDEKWILNLSFKENQAGDLLLDYNFPFKVKLKYEDIPFANFGHRDYSSKNELPEYNYTAGAELDVRVTGICSITTTKETTTGGTTTTLTYHSTGTLVNNGSEDYILTAKHALDGIVPIDAEFKFGEFRTDSHSSPADITNVSAPITGGYTIVMSGNYINGSATSIDDWILIDPIMEIPANLPDGTPIHRFTLEELEINHIQNPLNNIALGFPSGDLLKYAIYPYLAKKTNRNTYVTTNNNNGRIGNITPGFSGGSLLDQKADLIGINTTSWGFGDHSTHPQYTEINASFTDLNDIWYENAYNETGKIPHAETHSLYELFSNRNCTSFEYGPGFYFFLEHDFIDPDNDAFRFSEYQIEKIFNVEFDNLPTSVNNQWITDEHEFTLGEYRPLMEIKIGSVEEREFQFYPEEGSTLKCTSINTKYTHDFSLEQDCKMSAQKGGKVKVAYLKIAEFEEIFSFTGNTKVGWYLKYTNNVPNSPLIGLPQFIELEAPHIPIAQPQDDFQVDILPEHLEQALISGENLEIVFRIFESHSGVEYIAGEISKPLDVVYSSIQEQGPILYKPNLRIGNNKENLYEINIESIRHLNNECDYFSTDGPYFLQAALVDGITNIPQELINVVNINGTNVEGIENGYPFNSTSTNPLINLELKIDLPANPADFADLDENYLLAGNCGSTPCSPGDGYKIVIGFSNVQNLTLDDFNNLAPASTDVQAFESINCLVKWLEITNSVYTEEGSIISEDIYNPDANGNNAVAIDLDQGDKFQLVTKLFTNAELPSINLAQTKNVNEILTVEVESCLPQFLPEPTNDIIGCSIIEYKDDIVTIKSSIGTQTWFNDPDEDQFVSKNLITEDIKNFVFFQECGQFEVDESMVFDCNTELGDIVITSPNNNEYTIVWSDGTIEFERENLDSGIYEYIITDPYTCTKYGYVEVEEPNYNLDISITSQVIPCQGETNGSLCFAATGGQGPYTYSYIVNNNSGTTGQCTGDVLSLGDEVITKASDVCGNYVTETFIIQSNSDPIDISLVNTVYSSPGGSDGSIEVVATGGIEPYVKYVWEGDNIPSSITTLEPILENIPGGNYCVYILDDCGNISETFCFIVYEELTFTWVPESCGNIPGTMIVCLDIQGGNGDYQVQWQNVLQSMGTCALITMGDEICATVIDSDPNGYQTEYDCINDVVFDLELISIEPSCPNGHNGSICIQAINGVSPYSFEWSNGYSTGSGCTKQDLYGNTEYMVTVTDDCGTEVVATYSVPSLDVLDISGPYVSIPTTGLSNGSISYAISGGAQPITYTWTLPNGQNISSLTPELNNLGAGTYCLSVGDECHKKAVELPCVDLYDELTYTWENFTCTDNWTWLCLTPEGGSGNYEYDWTLPNLYGACIQANFDVEYCFNIIDSQTGQVIEDCIEIPSQFSIEMVSYDPPCPGESNGSICVQPVGGASNYLYNWESLSMGFSNCSANILAADTDYTITITDGCGTQISATFSIPSETYIEPTIQGVAIEDACVNSSNGSINLDVSGGNQPLIFNWSGSAIQNTTTDESALLNVPSGYYYLVIEDDCSISDEYGPFIIENYSNNIDLNLSWNIESSCSSTTTPMGSISLVQQSNIGPLEFEWSNGSTESDLNDIQAGDYEVTITLSNGCQVFDIVNVPAIGDFVEEAIISNSCGDDDIGSILLDLIPGSFTKLWSNGETGNYIHDLSVGTYYVTITEYYSGCAEVLTYIIEDSSLNDFEYEVEVLRFFNHYNSPNDEARLVMHSDQFEGGETITLLNTNVEALVYTIPEIVSMINIPIEYSSFNEFEFNFTSNEGCVFTGSFPGIPVCSDDNEGLSFSVEHIGNNEVPCDPNTTHDYNVLVSSSGQTGPYYFEVTMVEAVYQADENFQAIVEYTGPLNFWNNNTPNPNPYQMQITGIPPGTVRFESHNYCKNSPYTSQQHENCCSDISCNPYSETVTTNYNDVPAYRYNFEFFQVLIDNVCYDDCGGIFNPTCSEVIPSLNNSPPINNCWYGNVTIQYPTGPDAVFTVQPNVNPNEDVYDELYWISEHTWEAPNPGNYNVTITYTSDANIGIGTNCETVIEANFVGNTNPDDAIVFYDNYWWDNQYYADEFLDAYFGAYRCVSDCNPTGGPIYSLNSEDDVCYSKYNYLFTYFNYQPIDFDNACNSGGLLTILDYDVNGEVNTTEVIIPPNSAVNQHSGLGYQPFNQPENQWCMEAGWCLFDADEIYQLNDYFDQPLLASWFNPESCDELNWTEIDCEDTGCIFGECIDGECQEETSECYPPCDDDDFVCINGECVFVFNQDCSDHCQCSDGEMCVSGECIPVPNGGECADDCQCPPQFECILGECIEIECDCVEGYEYCDNDMCEGCPVFSVQYCFGDPTCGSSTDCIMNIRVSSSEFVTGLIEIIKDGVVIQSANVGIPTSGTSFNKVVPKSCSGGFYYETRVTFADCIPTTVPYGTAACLTGCFTGGGTGQNCQQIVACDPGSAVPQQETVRNIQEIQDNDFPNDLTFPHSLYRIRLCDQSETYILAKHIPELDRFPIAIIDEIQLDSYSDEFHIDYFGKGQNITLDQFSRKHNNYITLSDVANINNYSCDNGPFNCLEDENCSVVIEDCSRAVNCTAQLYIKQKKQLKAIHQLQDFAFPRELDFPASLFRIRTCGQREIYVLDRYIKGLSPEGYIFLDEVEVTSFEQLLNIEIGKQRKEVTLANFLTDEEDYTILSSVTNINNYTCDPNVICQKEVTCHEKEAAEQQVVFSRIQIMQDRAFPRNIKFPTSMLRLRLCDQSEAYVLKDLLQVLTSENYIILDDIRLASYEQTLEIEIEGKSSTIKLVNFLSDQKDYIPLSRVSSINSYECGKTIDLCSVEVNCDEKIYSQQRESLMNIYAYQNNMSMKSVKLPIQLSRVRLCDQSEVYIMNQLPEKNEDNANYSLGNNENYVILDQVEINSLEDIIEVTTDNMHAEIRIESLFAESGKDFLISEIRNVNNFECNSSVTKGISKSPELLSHESLNKFISIDEIKVNPNPFNQRINVSFNSSSTGNVNMTAYTITGQLVSKHTIPVKVGENNYETTLNDIPDGLILLRFVLPSGEEKSIKIIHSSTN